MTSFRCFVLIAKESCEVLKSEAFLSSSALVVGDILRMDTLHIREYDVQEALVKWSEQELARYA